MLPADLQTNQSMISSFFGSFLFLQNSPVGNKGGEQAFPWENKVETLKTQEVPYFAPLFQNNKKDVFLKKMTSCFFPKKIEKQQQ